MCKLNDKFNIILAKRKILLTLIYIECNQINYFKLFLIKSGSWFIFKLKL